MLMKAAVLLFGCVVLFQFVTLPVEFDASNRAKAVLAQTGIVSTQEEEDGVKKVLERKRVIVSPSHWDNDAGIKWFKASFNLSGAVLGPNGKALAVILDNKPRVYAIRSSRARAASPAPPSSP